MTIDRDAVVAEARSWLGTPYHHQAMLKGVGVDCAMILVGVYVAAGVIPATVDPRPYAPDWHMHRNEETYLGWLREYADQVDRDERPDVTDVVLWRYGRTFSHSGIVIDRDEGLFVHAFRDAGEVVLGRLSDGEFMRRPRIVFRVRG